MTLTYTYTCRVCGKTTRTRTEQDGAITCPVCARKVENPPSGHLTVEP